MRGIFGHHNSFWQYIYLTASGDLKRTKPSAGALVWHLRKALCMMLYVVDDAMPQQVPPKSLWIRRLYRVMYMVGNAVIRCELYLCWVEKNYAAGWLIFIMSRIEYTLVMCSKVKYWWSRIIHSLRCFWDICFMSGDILTGTIIWRPSVSMTLNLPRILKSSHLIPTFTLGILHIVLFLFNSFTFCFNTWECLINLFVDKIPVFI